MRKLIKEGFLQLNCCFVGIGCGFAALVASGALTGIAGYGVVKVLT